MLSQSWAVWVRAAVIVDWPDQTLDRREMTGNQCPPTELPTTLGWLVECIHRPCWRSYHSVVPGIPADPTSPLTVEEVGSSASEPTSPHDQTMAALSFRK